MPNTRWKEVRDIDPSLPGCALRPLDYYTTRRLNLTTPLTVSEHVRFTSYPAKRAKGSDTFRQRGNAFCSGDAPGPTKGTTGGKDWTVPVAFKSLTKY